MTLYRLLLPYELKIDIVSSIYETGSKNKGDLPSQKLKFIKISKFTEIEMILAFLGNKWQYYFRLVKCIYHCEKQQTSRQGISSTQY